MTWLVFLGGFFTGSIATYSAICYFIIKHGD